MPQSCHQTIKYHTVLNTEILLRNSKRSCYVIVMYYTLSELFLIRFYRIFFLNMWIIHLKVYGTKQIITKCTYIDIYVEPNKSSQNVHWHLCMCIYQATCYSIISSNLNDQIPTCTLFDIYSHKIRNL